MKKGHDKNYVFSRTGFAHVALILVILVIGIVVVLFLMPKPAISPVEPSATTSPTPVLSPTDEGLKTYTNSNYNFTVKYPSNYRIVEDKLGWPNAVLILYKGGQSYDFVVEVWNSESEYLTKYQNRPGGQIALREQGGKIFTLLNNNIDPEVDQILSTFEFTDSKKSNLQTCTSGFKFYENSIFSICYPENFSATTNTYPNAFGQAGLYSTSVVFEDEKEKVQMSTHFEGGWGGLNCENKQIDVLGYKARVLIWDKDEAVPCGSDLTSLVAIIGDGIYDRSTFFPISLVYQRKTESYLSREVFDTMLSSFKLK